MNPIEPRAQATLDAAMNLIRTAASSAAMRVAENLGHAAQAAIKISERDQLATTHAELRRNLGSFQNVFFDSLREKVAKDVVPRVDQKRKLESADWQTLSLVDEKEVEEQMHFVRLGQLISHECEWQLRDLAPYMGALLGFNSAADDRNPLRAEIVGAALHKGIEAISGERESRRILARDIGQAVAHVMPECYSEILRLLQENGRMTNAALAEAVGLMATPMLQRIRKLEQRGVITGYAAVVDPKAVGRGTRRGRRAAGWRSPSWRRRAGCPGPRRCARSG